MTSSLSASLLSPHICESNSSSTQRVSHEEKLLKETSFTDKKIQLLFHVKEGVIAKVINGQSTTIVPSYDIHGIPKEIRRDFTALQEFVKHVYLAYNPLWQGDQQTFSVYVNLAVVGGGPTMSKVRASYKQAQHQEELPQAAIIGYKAVIDKIKEIMSGYVGSDLIELKNMLRNSYFQLAVLERKVGSLEDALAHFTEAEILEHPEAAAKKAEVKFILSQKNEGAAAAAAAPAAAAPAAAAAAGAPAPVVPAAAPAAAAAAAAAAAVRVEDVGVMELRSILAHSRKRALEDASVQELCRLYTPLKCVSQANEMNIEVKGVDLRAKFGDFMRGTKKVFVVLGEAGGGKSSFIKYIERELWEVCNPVGEDATIVPVCIELGTLVDPVHRAVTEHLIRQGYTEQQIQTLKQKRQVLLILDGYDEGRYQGAILDQNLFQHNKLGDWNGKVVISGRLGASKALNPDLPGHIDKFAPLGRDAVERKLVEEVFIAPFFPSQIDEYIGKFVQHANQELKQQYPAWFANTHLLSTTIAQRPDLGVLVRTPFLLRSVVESLPEIMTAHRDEQVTEAMIYKYFTSGCFERELVKWLKNEKSKPEGFEEVDIGQAATAFCRVVARQMLEVGKIAITYIEEDAGMQQLWGDFFVENEELRFLRSICSDVIRKSSVIEQGRARNQYSFVHAKLRDYFFSID